VEDDMAQRDKVLDILSLATLPERAKIARLASQKVGQPFTMEHSLAVVRVYFEKGRTREIAQALFVEKHRQERLRNDRRAVQESLKHLRAPYTARFRDGVMGTTAALRMRKDEHIRHAQNIFGQDIEGNFSEDSLALMSLIQGDIRRYTVSWLDGSSRPVPSALIEVGVMVDGIFKGQHRVLLYKHEGRTLVAGTESRTTADAFAGQVPLKLVQLASELQENGCKIRTDFASQEMVITTADGHEKRMPWTGRTVE
jgi:hypothetical protein